MNKPVVTAALAIAVVCGVSQSADAQCPAGGTSATDVSGTGYARVSAITNVGSCPRAEINTWIDVPNDAFTCGPGAKVSGYCRRRDEYPTNPISAARFDTCGTPWGYSWHLWGVPGTTNSWHQGQTVRTVLVPSCPPPPPDNNCEPEYVWNAEWQTWQCPTGSPIVIAHGKSLNYRFTSVEDGVVFDLNGDGIATQMAWTVAGDDVGFLVTDWNNNGIIDDGTEMYGNFTVPGVHNGFVALAHKLFDVAGIRAGSVSAEDALYAKLQIWTDRNHNGLTDAGELEPFSRKFSDISLAYREHQRKDGHGNIFKYEGHVMLRTEPGRNEARYPHEQKQRRRIVYDVFLQVRP